MDLTTVVANQPPVFNLFYYLCYMADTDEDCYCALTSYTPNSSSSCPISYKIDTDLGNKYDLTDLQQKLTKCCSKLVDADYDCRKEGDNGFIEVNKQNDSDDTICGGTISRIVMQYFLKKIKNI